MLSKWRRSRRIVIAAMIMSAALVSAAYADQASQYAPNLEARTFANGPGGWTSRAQVGGVCVPGINCPIVTNSFQASGGASGGDDGYIRTELGSLAGAAAQSSGTWTSPPFVYRGAAGKAADRLTLSLSRRADVDTFLDAAGNSADWTVEILRGASGGDQASIPIDHQAVVQTSGWVGEDPITVNPDSLAIGQSYRLRIVTRFSNSASVVPGPTVDYDNVVLRAARVQRLHELRALIVKALPSTATVSASGDRIFVKMRCPQAVDRRCRYALVALTRRGGARVTLPRFARVAHGKVKTLGSVLRPGYRGRFGSGDKVLFRIRGRIGDRTVTVFRKLRLQGH